MGYAVQVEINGINYDLDTSTKKAEVVAKYFYKGDYVIPSSIIYGGQTYIVTSIGSSAFEFCSGLTSIIIPTSITSIGDKAFADCSHLTAITIPNTITSIEKATFARCSSLSSVTIPTSVTRIEDNAFRDCSNLTSITIPNSVISIGEAAFSGCSGLISVTFPTSVTSIGDYAFRYCSGLTSITFSNFISNIGRSAFDYCENLFYIYNLSETPLNCTSAFYHVDLSGMTLHVPSSSIPAYSGTAPWSSFGNIVALALNNLDLVDGEPYTNTRRTTYDAVTFSKTFASGAVNKWNALYVPISIDVASSNGEYDIAEIYAFCSTVDTNGDGTVDANDERFLFVRPVTSGRTYPNTPYLIRPREAKTYVINSADNILYEKRDGKVEFSTTKDKFTVTGLNESFTVVANDNNYYVTGTGALSYRANGSTTVKPNRWIMHREDREYGDIPDYVEDSNHLDNENNGSAGAKEYQIVVIGEEISEEDAIIAVKKANGVFTSGIYTLDGRKMNGSKPLPTSIYVKNGKKYIVK